MKSLKLLFIVTIITVSGLLFIFNGQGGDLVTPQSTLNDSLSSKSSTLSSANLALQASQKKPLQEIDIVGKKPTIPQFSSIQGTRIHGNLRVDDQGNLIIDNGIKKLFHYFLNLEGEISKKELLEKLRQGIADYLPQPAESQALEILTQYLAYKDAVQEQINQGLYHIEDRDFSGYRQAYDIRNQLRIQFLGAEVADAFFADEQAYDWYTVTRLELSNNASLTPEQRTAELSLLEEQLPESYRQVREKQQTRSSVTTEIQTLRDNNASLYDMQEVWTQHYGSEAAQRLAALETKRNQWQSRYEAYKQQRDALQSSSLDESSFAEQLSNLQQTLFSETERKRVQALDKNGT